MVYILLVPVMTVATGEAELPKPGKAFGARSTRAEQLVPDVVVPEAKLPNAESCQSEEPGRNILGDSRAVVVAGVSRAVVVVGMSQAVVVAGMSPA